MRKGNYLLFAFLTLIMVFLYFHIPGKIVATHQQAGQRISDIVARNTQDQDVLEARSSLPEYKKSLYRVRTNEKLVALTVDDGPDPRFTPKLLDILKKYNAHATFFLVGNQIVKYPYLAKRELQDGHEVGNHTRSHLDLLEITDDRQLVDEITGGKNIIQNVLGVTPKYFRAPKGFFNEKAYKTANDLGERVVMWTITLEHSQSPTPELMAQRIVDNVTSGNIILMHDARLDRSKSIKAIPLVIEGLQKKGYRIVTLSELLAAENHPVKVAITSQ